MTSAIRPFLDPTELEVLISRYLLKALKAEFDDDPRSRELALARAQQLKEHRSVS